jgi:hypothetical protein
MGHLDVRHGIAPEQHHDTGTGFRGGADLRTDELAILIGLDPVDDEVEPERSLGELSHSFPAAGDPARLGASTADHAEATRVGDRRREFGAGDPSHPGAPDRMIDPKSSAKLCLQRHTLIICPARHPRQAQR